MRKNAGNRLRQRSARRGGRWNTMCKVAVAVALVLAAANGVMVVMYRSRALPNSSLGRLEIGGKSFARLANASAEDVLPASLTLQKGTITQSSTPTAFGVSVDAAASVQSLENSVLRWVPLTSLLVHHSVPLKLNIDSARAAQTAAALSSTFSVTPQPQHIVFDGTNFVVTNSSKGFRLDTSALVAAVTAAIQHGRVVVDVPTVTLAAPTAGIDLSPQVQTLQKALETKVSFAYNGQTITPVRGDVGAWFAANGQSMAASTANISNYLDGVGKRLGVSIANEGDLATAAAYAVGQGLSVSLQIAPDSNTTAVRTYCTNVRGVSAGVLTELEQKLALTYTDVRGWSDGGHVAFQHVASGCQYTVWMAAASQMTSFGAICDDYYNCQIGTNVVMNYDRWTSATPPWNQTGGSLNDYHVLMIDHETGHRLGFADNPTCPGAGQLAPVMMQQSIDLKGCVFNIWPRPAELTTLNQMLGLGTIAPSSASE